MYFAFMELRTDLEKLHWYGVLNDTVLRMVIRYVQSKPDGEIFDQAISRLRSATMSVQIECQKELETLNCIIDLVAGRLKESMVQAGTSNLASSVEILQSEIESLDTMGLGLYIREAIIDLGRLKLTASSSMRKFQIIEDHDQDSRFKTLCDLLTKFPVSKICALWLKDQHEKMAIHYAVEYGLTEVFGQIWVIMISTGLSQELQSELKSSALTEGEISELLYLSVLGGHADIMQRILQTPGLSWRDRSPDLGRLLLLSLQLEQHEIPCLLIYSGAAVDDVASSEEAPLFLAARSGNEAVTTLLLERQSHLNQQEMSQRRTPLIAAAFEGHLGTIKLLLQSGADTSILDILNWSAADHAGVRGHLDVAQLLRSHDLINQSVLTKELDLYSPELLDAEEQVGFHARGFSVLQDHCKVLVHMGSWDLYKEAHVLTLGTELSSAAFSISNPVSGFSIGVSIIDGTGPTVMVPLPILDNTSNSPITFSTKSPTGFKVGFKLFRSDIIGGTLQEVLLGSGIALPASLKQGFGPDRESLVRDYTVPILSKEDLRYIATVTFSFLLVTPFSHHLASTPISTRDLWNKSGPTKVIGHRGDYVNPSPSDHR
ncbi:MAG: hypothetical protein CL912_08645 [Deltaproteobacteria bacterium]|nr:hypothetical protein [Deltaproteobacteria bacterium]